MDDSVRSSVEWVTGLESKSRSVKKLIDVIYYFNKINNFQQQTTSLHFLRLMPLHKSPYWSFSQSVKLNTEWTIAQQRSHNFFIIKKKSLAYRVFDETLNCGNGFCFRLQLTFDNIQGLRPDVRREIEDLPQASVECLEIVIPIDYRTKT